MKYIEKLGKIINIDNIYIELILITFISILHNRKNRHKITKENQRR